ncbi:hypothetical protein H4582DRAFT_2176304 [Lactarius indigo]|nr:hypothetical protein H4582DRAFT_2176304 [Lactarius indigo]
MSRAPHEANNVPGAGFDEGDQYPQLRQNQASHAASNFFDGSGPIFSMYMEVATEEDKKMAAENWKADADGILIFTGLFSAAVASFISVSIQDIRPNPQDTSNFYLANIYQTIADPSGFNISSSLPASPPPFSPPNYAIWVNSLWFMSLVISLTCALLVTLLQQWARRYLKVTQTRYSPHKRARIRAFFAEGVDKFLLPWVVETLPALLHISLFLFFAGLVVFLCNVYITTFKLVLVWVGVCTVLYGCITLMPIIRHDSPYYTSLSSSVWVIAFWIRSIISQVRGWFLFSVDHRHPVFRRSWGRYHRVLLQGMHKTAEETALESQPDIDARALMWTFDSLDEDHELERFFSGLPGIRSSKVVKDPLPGLTEDAKHKLSDALIGFFGRTFSSDLLPRPVKNHRAIICAKALDPLQFPSAFWHILRRVISESQHHDSRLQTTEFIRVMRGWHSGGDRETELLAEAMFTCLIARAQRRNNSWLIFAPNKLGIPEADLRRYATDSSLSLTSLIHIAGHQFSQFGKLLWLDHWFSDVLEEASKFNVQDTSPDLQHKFCALWNRIVLKVQNDDDRGMVGCILRPIRKVYIALHQGTGAAPTQFSASTHDWDDILYDPRSYPRCDIVSHIHVPSPTTLAWDVMHDDDALLPAPLTSPNMPSSSVPALPQILESLTDIPLDDFHLRTAHQMTTESVSFPVTEPDAATVDAFATPGRLIPHPTSATSTSTPPLSSTSPPAAVVLQHNADLMKPSDPPNHPSSASRPILGNTLPTERHCSEIIPTTLSASIGLASAPDLHVAVEDDGSPKLGPCKEKDALDPPLAICSIHANAMVTVDTPLQSPRQSPSLPSVTDMDSVSRFAASWRERQEETGYFVEFNGPSRFCPVEFNFDHLCWVEVTWNPIDSQWDAVRPAGPRYRCDIDARELNTRSDWGPIDGQLREHSTGEVVTEEGSELSQEESEGRDPNQTETSGGAIQDLLIERAESAHITEPEPIHIRSPAIMATITRAMEEVAMEEARVIQDEARNVVMPINPETGVRMTADDAAIFRAIGSDRGDPPSERRPTMELPPGVGGPGDDPPPPSGGGIPFDLRRTEPPRGPPHGPPGDGGGGGGGGGGDAGGGDRGHPSEKLTGEPPSIFDGDRLKVDQFLMQWHIYWGMNLDAPIMRNDYRRCLLFLSYIKGGAVSEWVLSFLNWLNRQIQRGISPYTRGLWDAVADGFSQRFENTLEREQAQAILRKGFKMAGEDIDKYVNDFEQLAWKAHYHLNEPQTIDLFTSGLPKELFKNAFQFDEPITFDDWKRAVLKRQKNYIHLKARLNEYKSTTTQPKKQTGNAGWALPQNLPQTNPWAMDTSADRAKRHPSPHGEDPEPGDEGEADLGGT